jgi:small subunit ribosomal protein S20
MAIKHAAAKAIRKSAKNHAFNLRVKAEFKGLVKEAKKLLNAKKIDEAKKAVMAAGKSLDKAARKKVITKNTAARLKSRLMKAMNKLGKK